MLKTAAVIIIGNEILSGKVKDENSHYLAQGLRELGVELSLVMVIPDRVPDIAEAVSMCSSRYDYVFTSGGIGPTHDDVTIQGIASAFGVKTEINRKLEEVILSRCGERPSDVALRMAELPQGAEVIELEGIGFPPVRMKNVFIFPGIPEFMRKKFDALKERFRSRPYHVRHIYINEEECFIAQALEAVAGQFSEVEIGSYPRMNEKGYKVVVTVESRDEGALNGAVERLLKLLPPGVVVRSS
ncbi:MAG: molybdopterin-binding protein [Nitrospiraceae bacterium]|nr:molybdopterin-binding protein [Nitrospiraceae bacterium]